MADNQPMLPFPEFQEVVFGVMDRHCATCGKTRPIAEFLRRTRPQDGYTETCLTCRRQPCACGCGFHTSGLINPHTKSLSRFVSGHHLRTESQKIAVRQGQIAGQAAGHYRRSPETRAKLTASKIGPLNPMYGNTEHMRRIAPNPGRQNGNYGHSARHGKGALFIRRDGSSIWLRSTWEVRVATWLDERQLTWHYERDRYEVGEKTYAPDFWIEEFGCYWEVKGWFHERHQQTIAVFRETYPHLPVVVATLAIMKCLFGGTFR